MSETGAERTHLKTFMVARETRAFRVLRETSGGVEDRKEKEETARRKKESREDDERASCD